MSKRQTYSQTHAHTQPPMSKLKICITMFLLLNFEGVAGSLLSGRGGGGAIGVVVVNDVKDKDVGNPELSPLTLTETLAQNILLMRCLECVTFCFAKVR